MLHNKVHASEGTCDAELLNSAFVFIKPHANTKKTQKLVYDQLVKSGIKILSEREIDGSVIDEKKLIDQHYYAIGKLLYSWLVFSVLCRDRIIGVRDSTLRSSGCSVITTHRIFKCSLVSTLHSKHLPFTFIL